MEVPSKRPYRMVARATAAAATGQRILDATVDIFWEVPATAVSLEEVARRSGVSVQTVLRRYGSREALLAAALRRETAKVRSQRDKAEPGNVRQAVSILLDHYEEFGTRVLRTLAEEERLPALKPIVDGGRVVHRGWCERVFAPSLEHIDDRNTRHRRLAQLVAVCDVYTWKLLRLDQRLDRSATELALVELINSLLEAA